MKRIICAVSAVALMIVSSCQKEFVKEKALAEGGLTISATVEQPVDDTRTYLDGTKVKWSENDAIKVFDTEGRGAKLVAKEGGKVTVSFAEPSPEVRDEGFDEKNLNVVFYPYGETVTCSGTTMTFTMPEVQTYAANTFASGANAMVGTVSGSGVSFKNVCGALKLDLKTTTGTAAKVGKIVVTDPVNNLWGDFTVEPGGAPEATYSANGGKSVTLVCPEGVEINDATNTFFYISLPVGALSNGFKVEVYSTKGHVIDEISTSVQTTYTNEGNIINRSEVRKMPQVAMKWLPASVEEIEMISDNGDNKKYINTRYFGRTDIPLHHKMEFVDKSSVEVNLLSGSKRVESTRFYFGNVYFTSSYIQIYGGTCATTSGAGKLGQIPRSYGTKYRAELYTFWDGAISGSNNWEFHLNDVKISGSAPSTDWDLTDSYYYLFCTPNATKSGFSGDLYYYQLFEGDTEVRYMIPCYNKVAMLNKEGDLKDILTTGMYDVVNGEFYTSAGSKEFSSSIPTVLSESDIELLEYVSANGNSYVSVNHLMESEKLEYVAKLKIESKGNYIAGSSNSTYLANIYTDYSTTGGKKYLSFYNINSTKQLTKPYFYSLEMPDDHIVEFDVTIDNESAKESLSIYQDGEWKALVSGKTYDTYGRSLPKDVSPALFVCGQPSSFGSTIAKGRLYYFRMFDDGDMVRNLVPCRVSINVGFDVNGEVFHSGAVGLYDKVSGYFFQSQGTEPFAAPLATE